MKKYFLFFALTGISVITQAQVKQGKIVYEKVVNLHKDIPENMEQFKAMMPEFRKTKQELLFNETQSISKNIKESNLDEAIAAEGESRGGRTIRFGAGAFGGGDSEFYKDYESETGLESLELGPKKYLVIDTLKPMKWKITGDTATIAGYLCYKATTTTTLGGGRTMSFRGRGGANTDTSMAKTMENAVNKEIPVEVWYAEKIETKAGPDNYFGLPGAVLKVNVNNGSQVITALEVTEGLGKETVKAPTKGTKITRAEHRKMMEEQMKNMRSMMGSPAGGGGTFRLN
ncbi:GLPGLI family protein [Polluticaenibacter yanchengensis]|uniref:GLPGLI family protein n=1 Tax=Polluticaenibacter yanchengensis TaxID=3014562 RepID=A0ABT4UN69_9BACT|nr:GLPGLI family protein [Chitinophagaceae bacterium LY-5]